MRKWMLAAGVAALTMAGPALADPKGDKGGGKAKAGQAQQGGGQGKAMKVARADRGNDNRGGGKAAKSLRAGNDQPKLKSLNVDGRRVVKVDRDRVLVRGRGDDDGIRIVRRSFDGIFPGLGLLNGCPPGLAKKNNGCMPPGHVNGLLGSRLSSAFSRSLIPQAYRNWYRDDDDYMFRAGDGFIYRVGRNNGLIDGLIPMSGNGFYALGDPWPDAYNFYNVPYQYRSYYADQPNSLFRYGGGAIYQVNRSNGLVEGIAALLAGDLGVGSRLPMGYDAYNVPFAYRDRYFDSPTAMYRYNDGYIYQVDPTTRLITTVIDALV